MIDVKTAGQLLDFGARMGQGPRANEQLEGAVAIHNILEKHRVAYLADEVGMGKTYVALGALALFRHFRPDFRVLVIAPKENIQLKWMKELRNFAAHNVRFPDLRVVSIDRQPARPLVACDNLIQFVREVVVDSKRDFFLRLSSFSLALGDDVERKAWRRVRDELRHEVPWLPEEALDLRSKKDVFKDNFARAICCALPVFDLVIVDEGHNLKHGFKTGVAARNRVLALALGHSSEESNRLFPEYGPRAKRVLFLSATPLEESYRHVLNQLDVCGLDRGFRELADDKLTDEEKKRVAAKFLVRRVTTMRVGGEDLTKNQYRREWRRGGVHEHDEPIWVKDDRERLVVALIQKKVAELLGSEKFNMSFQIGMLASFESFLETTRLKRADDETVGANFDDTDQTDDVKDDELRLAAREGIDVSDVNRLTRHYRSTFGREMPHPKMDALVTSLSTAWTTGRKALVFVRRVKSVDELKRKLDEKYDEWLIPALRRRLPEKAWSRYDEIVARYQSAKREAADARTARASQPKDEGEPGEETRFEDTGGTDTFFAWFFRGEGPRGVISGANVQRRFIQKGTAYSTFFEDNHVAFLLGVDPGSVAGALARACGLEPEGLSEVLRQRAAKYLSRARRHPRADRMEAAQAAAVELLAERNDALGERARLILHERFEASKKKSATSDAPDVSDALEYATFFTEIRGPERTALREVLWPAARSDGSIARFREEQLRGQLLSTAARLGHSLIDLYALTIGRIGSIELRALEGDDKESGELERRRINEYLDLLEVQRVTPVSDREWGAFDELSEIAQNFDLILDVNASEARVTPLEETARYFGALLREQQPVGGMSGQVNKTLRDQFRMPGYPFVLVTTDLLQEGEDLHTFCSAVYHYGIAWTPSSMEQRIGRIDRVRSQTERRLSGAATMPEGDELLQVYYPHLEDTVEVLQVQRVLARMNVFLRLMHEGLAVPKGDHRQIDVGRELAAGQRAVETIRERLQSAFPVPAWALDGSGARLLANATTADAALNRFEKLTKTPFEGLAIEWERSPRNGRLLGTVKLSTGRIQPFTLVLKSEGDRLVLRCISPVGRVGPEEAMALVEESARRNPARVGAIVGRDDLSYDLTVEDDVVLGDPSFDSARAVVLLGRVAQQADALEQIHLPFLDQALEVFQTDLSLDGGAAGL